MKRSDSSPATARQEDDPYVTHPDQFIRVQTSATNSRVFRVTMNQERVWGRQPYSIGEELDPDIRRMIEKEGARPSSLIPVHKLNTPDPLYDMQLLRALKVANERTVRELGPLPPGGLPVRKKRKPKLSQPAELNPAWANIEHKDLEGETMKFSHTTAASALMTMGITVCHAMQTAMPMPTTVPVPITQAQQSRHLLIRGAPGSKPWKPGDESDQPLDAIESEVPPSFDSFGPSSLIGGDRYCAVGAVADEDNMNHRPYVYIADASGKRTGWVKPLNVPRNFYESVAIRCLRKGDALYVLQSSNTLMQPSLTQVLLRLVKLNLANGHIEASVNIEAPGVGGVYSTWVNKGPEGLTISANGVAVAGEYFFQDGDKGDQHFPFEVSFDDNLIPLTVSSE